MTVPAGKPSTRGFPPPTLEGFLPTFGEGEPPEPLWAERELTALAPAFDAGAALPLPAVSDAPLHQRGVGELLAAYAAGTTDPIAVLAALESRADTHPSGQDTILAFIAGARDAAVESAERIASGTARPLEGIPFGVKDIIDVADAPVTAGSLHTRDRIAAADSTIVARLRAAGAIPYVMTATTEFASGSAHNARYGAVHNPWNRERWTGGSSTGSGGGLAARLFPLALGSDTGGSIRIPAAFCGITGLKPTRGLVPRSGAAALSWTLDHIGPMARSAEDLARVMPHITGPDGLDFQAIGHFDGSRARSDIAGLRIGVPSGWFTDKVDAAVIAAWRDALAMLEAAGAKLVPIDLGPIDTIFDDAYAILYSELASLQEASFNGLDYYDPGTRGRIEAGRQISAIEYLRHLRRRPLVMQQVLGAMANVDVLVTPGPGGEAGFLEDLTMDVNGERLSFASMNARNTILFDYTGLPALMLPSGKGKTGLPVAIQIVGKLFDDALCLSVGAAFQRLTDHHLQSPPET